MAMPSLSHEDLQKLKDFIDFVTANPKILNFPKLDFVKKFIEKFGGKVPPGEFQMPGECKCPFSGGGGAAGGVKTEGNTAEAEEDSEPDEAEMESDPESEIELDMEVKNLQKRRGAKRQAINAVFVKESMEDKNVKKNTRAAKMIKKDSTFEDEEYNMTDCASDEEEDPINTSLAYCVKAEVEETSGDNFNYQEDSDENEEIIEKPVKPKSRKTRKRKAKNFWKSSSKREKVKKPKRFKCNDTCKHNCKTLIDKQWRQDLCAEFWNMRREDRKNYVLKFVDKKPVLTIRRNRSSSGYSNVYFLKNRNDERVRVCVGYFLSTLSVTRYFLKRAVDNIDSKDAAKGQESSSGLKEKTDHTQEEETVRKNQTTEGDSNIEKKPEIIEKQSSLEDTTKGDLEIQKEGIAPIAPAKDLKLPQQPRPPKPRPSTKGRAAKKERRPKPVQCDEVCKMKCTSHFSEEQRVQICATYWSMDYKRRMDFLLSRIETRDVLTTRNEEYRKTKRAKRSFSNRFYFRGGRSDKIRVCLNFFTSTLCIGRRTILNAIKNVDPNTGSYAGADKRGRNTSGNKIPEDLVLGVKRHIDSYPTWVPHKKYKTRFLHSSLNIEKMYREYKQTCTDQQRKFVNSAFFRKVFHKDYRLAFLKPNSKHAHKVSPNRKDNDGEAMNKKINPNISEFTGEEGGFWIPAEPDVAVVSQIGNQQQQQNRTEYTQMDAATYDVNRFNIQQNLQLQAPLCVQPTPFLNAVNIPQCSGNTNYLHQQAAQQTQQNDLHNVISTYTNPAYVQDPSVFRML